MIQLGLTLFMCACGLIAGGTILLIGYNVLTKGYFRAKEPNPNIMVTEMIIGGVMILAAIATAVITCLT